MKKYLAPLAAAGLLVGSIATAGPALADKPGTSSAEIIGTVKLINPTTAEVQVRYSCTGELGSDPETDPGNLALWVSVKQTANGTADPGLAEEGSGYNPGAQVPATAWSQSHAGVAKLDCDGRTHVGRFIVDREEFGRGALQRGRAYVQFCLFDATTPVTDPEVAPISDFEFVNVR